MTFDEGTPTFEPVRTPSGDVAAGPYYVLDSGDADGQPWNLLAYASNYPVVPTRVCIGLEIYDHPLASVCDTNIATGDQGFEGNVARVRSGGSIATYAWGALSPANQLTTVRTELETGTLIHQAVRPLPGAVGVPFRALVVVGDADASGVIRSTAQDGSLLGAFPFALGGEQSVDVSVPQPPARVDAAVGQVLATGTFRGRPFEVVAYVVRGAYCLGTRGSVGGGACPAPGRNLDHVGPNGVVLDQGATSNEGGQFLAAGWGTAGSSVDAVVIHLDDGRTITPVLFPGPKPESAWGSFRVFAFNYAGRTGGVIQGLDARGNVIGKSELRVP